MFFNRVKHIKVNLRLLRLKVTKKIGQIIKGWSSALLNLLLIKSVAPALRLFYLILSLLGYKLKNYILRL